MNKSILKNTFAGIGATVVALSIGYFGIQYIGRYTMFAISGGMIGLSAVAYLTEKWLSSQQFKAGVNLTKATSISKPYSYCRRRLVICHRARVNGTLVKLKPGRGRG